MRKILKIVEDNRASTGLRFANLIIDKIVLNLSFFLFGVFAGTIDNILGIYYFTKIIDNLSGLGRLADILITSFVYFIYVFLMEYFTKGRTLGKYITGTRVITTDGHIPTLNDFFVRNISRLVPFDAFSFLGGGNGWHDSWSDTRVINIKKYEAEKQIKEEINSLGAKEIA